MYVWIAGRGNSKEECMCVHVHVRVCVYVLKDKLKDEVKVNSSVDGESKRNLILYIE